MVPAEKLAAEVFLFTLVAFHLYLRAFIFNVIFQLHTPEFFVTVVALTFFFRAALLEMLLKVGF